MQYTATVTQGVRDLIGNPMEADYDWSFRTPGEALSLRIASWSRDGEPIFEAALGMQRRELDARSRASVLARHPLMTLQVFAGIYWQAYRLRRKGAPTHPHPAQLACATELETQS